MTFESIGYDKPCRSFRARCRAPVILLGILIAGCESTPQEPPPAVFDLSGTWELNTGASDAAPDLQEIRRLEDRDVLRGRQRDAEASSIFVTEDFPVLDTPRMTIEQDARSMGIRYADGTYRDVSWGERERGFWTIRAGWREGALVIDSRRNLTRGRETMRLERGGRRLRVDVSVETGGRDVRSVRVFDRR